MTIISSTFGTLNFSHPLHIYNRVPRRVSCSCDKMSSDDNHTSESAGLTFTFLSIKCRCCKKNAQLEGILENTNAALALHWRRSRTCCFLISITMSTFTWKAIDRHKNKVVEDNIP